jgi:hypothetical protein
MRKERTKPPVLARDPVERIGNLLRTVPSVNRLKGKNKLDARQAHAAEEYRDAYETIRTSLGGAMDFDRVRGGGGSVAPAEAALIAGEKLRKVKAIVGQRAILIVEHIVCQGRTVEECARIMYGYVDGQATSSRDVNYVGRALREALSEMANAWHPIQKRQPIRGMSASRLDQVVGAAGVIDVSTKPYVMRG